MAARLQKTRYPGVYKRGGRYIVAFRDGDGKQRWRSARTAEDARRLKATFEADVARGEFHVASRLRLREYAEEWVERYQGRGHGFRESTRTDYRRHLNLHIFRYFGPRKRLAHITPHDVSKFVGWLGDEERCGRAISDKTIKNIVGTLRSCMASAVREGLIRHNPVRDVALPHREEVREDGEDLRVFTRKQLADFLSRVHPDWRPMFRLLASTGLRWSELVALQWRHLHLNGAEPHVKVRRALVRGRIGPPKSSYGRRNIPLDLEVVSELRRYRMGRGWPSDDMLVFSSQAGTALDHSNVLRRVLRPIAEEIGAPWAGFHSFRHTAASLLFERGKNAVQVQRWLGHHSPSFTIDCYVHSMSENLGEPLSLDIELKGANKVQTDANQTPTAAVPTESAPATQKTEPTQLHRTA